MTRNLSQYPLSKTFKRRIYFPKQNSNQTSFLRYVESSPFRYGQIALNPYKEQRAPSSILKALAATLPLPAAEPSARGLTKGELTYLALIKNAKESIHITNPYFVLSERLESALLEALARGVQVELFTNSIVSANPLELWDCSSKGFSTFLKAGARIFEFQGTTGMMHTKRVSIKRSQSSVLLTSTRLVIVLTQKA